MILLCFLIAGCSHLNQKKALQVRAAQLEQALSEKEAELERLQGVLDEQESLLKQRELKIEELRKKLAGLGVF